MNEVGRGPEEGGAVALLEAVASGAEALLRATEPEQAIAALLERLGGAARASRTYLFTHRRVAGDLVADQKLEWVAPGVAPQIENPVLQGWSYRASGNSWLPERFAAGAVVAAPTSELPATIQELLRSQSIESIAMVPVPGASEPRGFLGFDDCARPRRWSEAELAALRLAASLVAAALEREVAERALRSSEEQLGQAAQMESWGRFAAGLARDFDTLVRSIAAFGERFGSRLGASDPLRAELTELLIAGERAAELTRDLLAFGRQQPARLQELEPRVLLTQKMPLLRRIVGDGIAIGEPTGDSVAAVADAQLIEQALVTLCLDAREALGGSGRIDFTLASVSAEQLARRGAEVDPSASFVRISLVDDRPALDRESASRLFEPFFTTERLGRGRGLGLSTVYGAVRQCGGFVFVESSVERGTVFDLYLPAVERAAPAGSTATDGVAAASDSPDRSRPRVLLVEDEDLIRSLAEQILSERGYRVVSASNASEALDLATQSHEPIDLLLTDIVMPGVSGSDLAQRLLRSFPEMRVLYMSGYSDSLIFRYGVLQERSAFLQKPFSAEVLERKVRDLLAS